LWYRGKKISSVYIRRGQKKMSSIPLSLDEINRRRELTRLFTEDRISRQQAGQLRNLLERERAMAEQQGNDAIVVALGFLLGLVIRYLVSEL